jgi:hypothetical protein
VRRDQAERSLADRAERGDLGPGRREVGECGGASARSPAARLPSRLRRSMADAISTAERLQVAIPPAASFRAAAVSSSATQSETSADASQ